MPLLFVFIFGTIIGSFLNVLILRYNSNVLKRERSECFSCGHELAFYDLIPILSFIFLKTRCRYCKSKISFQYPLVEFFTGLTFLLVYIKVNSFSLDLFFYFLVFSILIAIFVYDLRHKIIPDGLVYTLIAISLFKTLLLNNFYFLSLFSTGVLVMSLPLFLLWLISSGKWMGFGDVKLTLALGLLLGFWDGVGALTLSFWLGAIIGLILVLLLKLLSHKSKNLTIKSEIPFAPFLILGFAIVFFTNFNPLILFW